MFNKAPDSLSITSELLGLSEIKVTGVRFNSFSTEIIITAVSTPDSVLCRKICQLKVMAQVVNYVYGTCQCLAKKQLLK